MRRMTLLLIVSVVATAVLALFTLFTPTAQADEVGGIIDTDTTWTLAGSPYIITDTVIIQPGVTLTVEAGVEVQAQPNRGITVNGLLLAVGTAVQPITFTSTTENGLNNWHGLDVTGSGAVSLTHTTISYAYSSLEISGATANSVQLSNSTITQNDVALGSEVNAIHRLVMHNVTFSDNDTNYVLMGGSSDTFSADVTLSAQPGLDGYWSEPLWLTVPEGLTLTIDADTTLRSLDYMRVNGHLETKGTVTATAVITGFSGIQIEATGSANINHTLITNGLGDGYFGFGILGNSTKQINIQNSSFTHLGHPIVIAPNALHRLHMENVTFTDNLSNRVFIYGSSGTLADNVTLTPQPGLEGYEIESPSFSTFEIPSSITLTLEAGATLFGANVWMYVNGHFAAEGTITATSTISSFEGLYVSDTGSITTNHAHFYGVITPTDILGIGFGGNSDRPIHLQHTTIEAMSYPILAETNALHRLFMENVTFVNNDLNRVIIDLSGDNTLGNNTTLTAQPGLEGYEIQVPNFSTFEIPTGITLTLTAGARLWGENVWMSVHGNLSADGLITATSIISGFEGIFVQGTGSLNTDHTTIYGANPPGNILGLGFGGDSDHPIHLQNTTIEATAYPIVGAASDFHRLQMENVTFVNNGQNRVIIDMYDTNALSENTTLTDQPGLEGYEVLGGNEILYVPQGITLTLAAGATLLDGDVLFVNGHLAAEGFIANNASILNFCVVYFSLTGSANLAHTLIDGGGECPYFEYGIGIEGDSDEPIIVHNSTIQNIEGYPILTNANNLHRLQMENVTFADNSANHVFISTDGGHDTLAGNVTLTSQPGLAGYEVIDGNNLTIPDGLTLTLAADNSLIMPALGYLQVEGRLQAEGTAVAPVTFTSSEENASGQWAGIVVDGGEVSLAHAEVRYATTNLTVNSPTSTVTITSSRFISASVDSIVVNDGSLYAACSVIAGSGQNGVSVSASGSPSVIISTSEIWGNGVGITNSHSLPVDARHNFWGDPSGPGGIGPGSGDAVYGNVLYNPWLAEPTCTPPPPPITPTISISDSTAVESTPFLTFTVTLNITSEQDVLVDYATVDGTAVAGVDYQPISGTLTIPAGQVTAVLTVPLLDNDLDDGDRTFTLVPSNPVNGELGNGTAVGLILDDDSPVEPLHTVFLPVVIKP